MNWFLQLSRKVERGAGSPWTFITAVVIVLIWMMLGPVFDYSSDWQLWINTGTTIITFLMVFLIQATQDQNTRALHLKLDELIRVTEGARNSLMISEDITPQELERLKQQIVEQPLS